MKSNPILRVLSAAVIGFLIGVPFAVQMTSKLFPLNLVGDGNYNASGSNIFARFSTPFRNSTSNYTAEGTPLLQSNATSDSEVQLLSTCRKLLIKSMQELFLYTVYGLILSHIIKLWR